MRRKQLIYWSTVAYSVLRQRNLHYYYSLGYPKSGTGWLSRLMVDYLGIPNLRLKHRRGPALSPCVIKMHRFLKGTGTRNRTIYIVRDPRDIVVSYYWHVLRHGGSNQRELEAATGTTITPENIVENLPSLIRNILSQRCAGVSYSRHISRALAEGYVIVRYEDLLSDCLGTLSQAFSRLPGHQLERRRLEGAVSRHTFEAETGRERGIAAPDNYIRKGVAGEWKHSFCVEAKQQLDALCGDTLLQLEYESNRDWVNRVTC